MGIFKWVNHLKTGVLSLPWEVPQGLFPNGFVGNFGTQKTDGGSSFSSHLNGGKKKRPQTAIGQF